MAFTFVSVANDNILAVSSFWWCLTWLIYNGSLALWDGGIFLCETNISYSENGRNRDIVVICRDGFHMVQTLEGKMHSVGFKCSSGSYLGW